MMLLGDEKSGKTTLVNCITGVTQEENNYKV